MLTRELAIVDYRDGKAHPDRLTRLRDAQYVPYAEAMCQIYRYGVGRTRKSLHDEVVRLLIDEPNCHVRRIGAFCKLLDEASEFHRDEKGTAAKLRRDVFRSAAAWHPLVQVADPMFEVQEDLAKQKIATERGTTWAEIDAHLFADIPDFHTLISFKGFEKPSDLLARYNVAQVQVALYDAVSMTIWAKRDFKSILRYAKLAQLMHRIEPLAEGGYRFDFDGPASLLKQTHRYGVCMARFLPGLLSCQGWRMLAWLKPSRWNGRLRLELDDQCGLTSPVVTSQEYDSQVEAAFVAKWGEAPRRGWTLERETELLHEGQKVFFPDFVFRHADGRKVYMEVVGFWTPEYLAKKRETLERFSGHRILLVVQHSLQDLIPVEPARLITYKTAIKIDEVLSKLESIGAAIDKLPAK